MYHAWVYFYVFIILLPLLQLLLKQHLVLRLRYYHLASGGVYLLIGTRGNIQDPNHPWGTSEWSTGIYTSSKTLSVMNGQPVTDPAHDQYSSSHGLVEYYHWGIKNDPELYIRIGGCGSDGVVHYRPIYDGLYTCTICSLDFTNRSSSSLALMMIIILRN